MDQVRKKSVTVLKSCGIAYLLMPLFLLCSCKTVNPYENNYYSAASEADYVKAAPGTIPDMQEIADWEMMRSLQEEGGYIVIGVSAFTLDWAPRILALECAKRNGAAMILFHHKPGSEKAKSRTFQVPVQHKGMTYGMPGGYSWMTTMHGTVPVTVNSIPLYYPQYAYYLAKRKYISSFGVYFRFPENIPGNRNPRIQVGIVVPDSQAARQGIKPGDTVYSINGRRVFSAEDVRPYAVNQQVITRLEVTRE